MAKVQNAFYYFVGETANRFAHLQSVFSAPITELYLLFYQSALQVFLHFNIFLQREDPFNANHPQTDDVLFNETGHH